MSERIAVAVVHGIGAQGPDFAEPVITELTDRLVDDLRGPVLLVHGTADTLIGFDHSRELSSRLGARSTLVPLEGIGHNDLWEARETTVAIRDFVAGHRPRPPSGPTQISD